MDALTETRVERRKESTVANSTKGFYPASTHLSAAGADISELTLGDKERILRLLFAKMNGELPRDKKSRQKKQDEATKEILTKKETVTESDVQKIVSDSSQQ